MRKSIIYKFKIAVFGGVFFSAVAAQAGFVNPQDLGQVPRPADTPAFSEGGDSPVGAGTLFNPEISAILDFTYGYFEDGIGEPEGYELAHDHGHDHAHGLEEGFSIREAEITMAGALDPYFDMMLMLAVTNHDIEIEEGYITSRSLPSGLGLKAGKFMSDTGYINKQHPHEWLFIDQPWMSEYLLGEEGLTELGLQLSWMPPTVSYTRLGVEVLEGKTEGVANYVGEKNHTIVTILPKDPGTDDSPERNRWQADMEFEDVKSPRLYTGFLKWGPDIGFDHAVQFGLWGGYGSAFQAEDAHSSGRLETWDGESLFGGADVVYKYNGQGVMGHRNMVLQGEYMYRRLDLRYKNRNFSDFSTLKILDEKDQLWKQDGLYLQGVYGFAPRWNAGLRFDALGLTNSSYEGPSLVDDDLSMRYTGQISYAPTEFSRFRLQGSYDDPYKEHGGWKVVLQYNVSLGVHGAHAF